MQSEMDILVYEVHKRNVLWNKRHPLYKDRLATDKEWEIVSRILGVSKNTAKKKWRNLRDQFFKELKKIPKIDENNAQNDSPKIPYPGKWKFFRKLLFLKQTMNQKEGGSDPDRQLSPLPDDYPIYTHFKSEPDMDEEDSLSVIKLEACEEDESKSNLDSNDKRDNESRTHSKKRKRSSANELDLKLLEIEAKRLAMLEASEDENSLFLRSLVPFLRKMDPLRQLRVRMKFQEILLKEAEEMQRQSDIDNSLNDLSSACSDKRVPTPPKS